MKLFKEVWHEKRTDPVMDNNLHCTQVYYLHLRSASLRSVLVLNPPVFKVLYSLQVF
jgi:hypothetical protein